MLESFAAPQSGEFARRTDLNPDLNQSVPGGTIQLVKSVHGEEVGGGGKRGRSTRSVCPMDFAEQILSEPQASDLGGAEEPMTNSARVHSSPDQISSGETLSGVREDFAVSMEFFSGPMDLLLHLVRQQELPIEHVRMTEVAERYLAVISQVRLLDLDLASEYLVIAATLLTIKSESLLPANLASDAGELPIEERSEAFYEELRARLKAYEETKRRAEELMATPQLGADTFTRIDRRALLPTPEMLAEPEDVTSLALLFGKLLKRVGKSARSFQVRFDSISVVSYMMKIVDSFSGQRGASLTFASLAQRFARLRRGHFETGDGSNVYRPGTGSSELRPSEPADRPVLIGAFCAVLELVKRGVLQVAQERESGDISLSLGMVPENELNPAELSSEFDAAVAAPADGAAAA